MSVRTTTSSLAGRARRALPTFLVAGALAAAVAVPGTASAGAETLKRAVGNMLPLKRAVGNMLQAPVDLVLAPVTAGLVEYRTIRASDDILATKVAYAVPGYVFLTGLHAGGSALRAVSGIIELVPGMAMLFTDSELEPMYDPAEKSGAVILDRQTPLMEIRLGIDYTGIDYR